jgi:hypothetical protein
MKKESTISVRTSLRPFSRQTIEVGLSKFGNAGRVSRALNTYQSSEDVGAMFRKEQSALRKKKKSETKQRPFLIGYIGRIKEKVRRLRHRLGFGKIENLSSKQLMIINDRSHYTSFNQTSPRFDTETSQNLSGLSRVNFPKNMEKKIY